MTILLVRSDREERTRRAKAALSDRFPGEEVQVIERGQGTASGAGVFVPWPGRPWSLAPVSQALRRLRGGARVQWIDDEGNTGPCGPLFFLRECARLAGFRLLDATARLFARALVASRPPERIGGGARPTTTSPHPNPNPLHLLIPVLPDLSHTFIYREVQALLDVRPDIRVTCLLRGTRAPVHAEAARLLPRIAFLPRQGVLGRYASVFTRFLVHPRRTGSLLALYARRPGGSTGDLFGKGPLDDPMHPGNAFALADALEAAPPSHLHAYGSTYPANVAMGAACLLDIPFSISSYVDFDFDYDFKLLVQKHRLARFFRVCTSFCRTTLARILALQPEDSTVPVIVWGLDLADWTELSAPPGKAVLLTASRLVPKKGLHLVPPALARLVERGLDPTWIVAGDGPEAARLRALVGELGLADRVRFVGPLPNDAVKELLLRCDVALLPCVVAPGGERDGVPVFLTEAMACGVPVVSSPVSAVPEVVRHGETGFLSREGDAGALADCLESVLRDPGAARAVGMRGREFVLATHDARASARELLGLITAGDR